MTRKIFGTIRDEKSGRGLAGLKIEVWDDDFPDGDDFMGATLTEADGSYAIPYTNDYWNSGLMRLLPFARPDLYVSVHIQNQAGLWVEVTRSRVYQNHKMDEDLQIDLQISLQEPVEVQTGFLPQEHGFHFVNYFKVKPDLLGVDLGEWLMGFCGGMSAAARTRFLQRQPVPPVTKIPQQGETLFDELRDRQMSSLLKPRNILDDLLAWQTAPDEGHWLRKQTVGQRTQREWEILQKQLDAGHPTVLVLIRVGGLLANPTLNHQVLAIGYHYHPTTRDLAIQVYDPNRPKTTQVLTMNTGLPNQRLYAQDSTNHLLRGFFCNPNSLEAFD